MSLVFEEKNTKAYFLLFNYNPIYRFWKTHKSWLKGLKSLLQLAKERALYGDDPDTPSAAAGNDSKAQAAPASGKKSTAKKS